MHAGLKSLSGTSMKKGKPINLAMSVTASISFTNLDKQETLLYIPQMGR